MEQHLNLVGLSLDHPDVILFEAVRPSSKGEFPTVGAKGCFLSHLGVLEDAIAADCSSFLILEDDVDFSVDFPDRIEGISKRLNNQEWDIFYG